MKPTRQLFMHRNGNHPAPVGRASPRGRSLHGGLLLAALWCWAAQAGAASLPELSFAPTDRILILAPHPDDEVLGCAGVIQQAQALKLPVRVVFLTHGDENQWSFMVYRKHPVLLPGSVRRMGEVRHQEALAAGAALGLAAEQMTFLGYPDFGTLAIWNEHWEASVPYRSLLTRVRAVPYADAMRPGAPHKGEEILRDLTTVLREFRPTKVFVSHPADHNGDHRALYLFTRVALWDLAAELKPEIFPYLIHFRQWPPRTRSLVNEPLAPPQKLRDALPWRSLSLTPAQVERKLAALQAHRSQYQSNRRYLRSFVRVNELFGDFHGGVLPLVLTNAPPEPLIVGGGELSLPEQLTDAERAEFVGVDLQFARIEDNHLVLTLQLSRPLVNEVQAVVSVFGYRADRPFRLMPKVRIRLGELTATATDQTTKLAPKTVTVTRDKQQIVLRIPRGTLGNPARVMVGARTTLVEVPLDWVAWRILEWP